MSSEVENKLRDSWHANAAAWTAAVRGALIPSRRAGTDAAIVEALTARGAGRVLDVGCGEGWLARELAERGFTVTGFDVSAPLIDEARRLGGGSFTAIGYDEVIADPARLGGPFDLVVCNFSLLGESVAPLLGALRTLLAEDGAIVIQTVHPVAAAAGAPYRDGWKTERWEAFGEADWKPMPWYFRTLASWMRELRDAGLTVVDCVEPLHPETEQPLSLLLTCR
ncbi:MAG TPA: class I SAM-dependent methyltransferase [Longimicrobium sp.]|jgi:2-polyprenyl-3-methyl-5-hydroxy-6-metoxy-1,4-benzoquinol methylase